MQNVPPIQKRLIRRCRAAAKPVIVATQMLESMIESPMPTRAEVSDVATAIYEGSDAIMLSAESAAGDYPVEAVTTMNNVAVEVESDPTYTEIMEASRVAKRATVADGIVAAAREIAETTDIKAICCFTSSGTTALLTARERPRVPIIAMTNSVRTARRLALTWGTECVITGELERFKQAVGQRGPCSACRWIRGNDGSDPRDSRCALQHSGHNKHPSCCTLRRTFDLQH